MVRSLALVVVLAVLSTVLPYALGAPGPGLQPHGWRVRDGDGTGYANGFECTPETQSVRYDFEALAPEDRKAYTDAVKCLMAQPSELDPTLYPGAKNRYLDFATIHINRTLTVHLDGFFFTWHRMFVHLFEQELKHKCGFQGTQPYWNWPETAFNLTGSIIFDGSEYSMSGDGYYNNTGDIELAPTLIFPPGSGGGCIMSGPFEGLNQTMDVISVNVITDGDPLPSTAFDYNPSCIIRDLNSYVAEKWTNETDYEEAIVAPDIATYSYLLNGSPITGNLGLHSGAHFTMGGQASNLFASAQDPIWYPLHTFLDKLYVTWQDSHPDLFWTLSGTETALNIPPSPNVTLTTMEPDWDILYPSVPVWQLMNITSGPFCYRYE